MTSGRNFHRARPSNRPDLAVALTREERLERKLARARAQRDAVRGQRDSLHRRVRALEARRAWAESYLGFRVEYALRGALRRLRRYWRVAWRTVA